MRRRPLVFLATLFAALLVLPRQATSLSQTSGDLAGTVLDTAHQPIPNATVEILFGPVLGAARTDANGRYRLTDLPEGTYQIVARKPAYAPVQRDSVEVAPNHTTTSNFTLEWATPGAGAIEALVTNNKGVVLDDATVDLLAGAVVLDSIPADELGSAVFPGLAPGVYGLRAHRSGYFDVTRSGLQIRGKRMTTAALKLQRNATEVGGLEGVVQSLDGGIVSRATVKIVQGLSSGQTSTGSSGRFRFNGLVPGRSYAIQVSAPGFNTQTLGGLEVRLAQSTAVVVNLVPDPLTKGSIMGLVTDPNGAPLPFSTVTITAGPGAGTNLQTNADGRYAFASLKPDDGYAIIASVLGYNPAGARNIVVEAGHTTIVDLVLQPAVVTPGSLSGTVRTTSSRQVLANALVEITSGPSAGLTALTDGLGRYEFPGVIPDDNYALRFSKNGFQPATQSFIRVRAGLLTQANQDLSPISNTGGTITGTVKDITGPLSGATVTVTAGPTDGLAAQTDQDGTYTLKNLRAGTYSLKVTKQNFVTKKKTGVTVTSGHTTVVNFGLTQGSNVGTIVGRVLDLNLHPISGAHVHATAGPDFPADVFTDDEGNFRMTQVTPGTYTLEAVANGFRNGTQTFSVGGGGTTAVTFRLIPL